MNKILEFIESNDLYIALTGIIGAIIQYVRKNMSVGQFIKLMLLSCFFGYAMYKSLLNYTDLKLDIIIVICCGFSGFSQIIFDEVEELISKISEFFTNFINNKINK